MLEFNLSSSSAKLISLSSNSQVEKLDLNILRANNISFTDDNTKVYMVGEISIKTENQSEKNILTAEETAAKIQINNLGKDSAFF